MISAPTCKLCSSIAHVDIDEENITAWCSNDICPLHDPVFPLIDWVKLNILKNAHFEGYIEGFAHGYALAKHKFGGEID